MMRLTSILVVVLMTLIAQLNHIEGQDPRAGCCGSDGKVSCVENMQHGAESTGFESGKSGEGIAFRKGK